jgi:hypothetical protein
MSEEQHETRFLGASPMGLSIRRLLSRKADRAQEKGVEEHDKVEQAQLQAFEASCCFLATLRWSLLLLNVTSERIIVDAGL